MSKMIYPRPDVLLYDWDNTLADGWTGITAAMNVVLVEFGMPVWTVRDTKNRARTALRKAFPVMFGDRWEHAADVFHATYRDQHLIHVRPIPGAAEALEAGAAWPQAVVSNKTGPYLRAEVAHFGWSRHFGAVIGAGDAVADKPDPAPLRLALQQLGLAGETAVWYLGDTALDMQTARAAGAVAVLIGDAEHDGGIAHTAPDVHFASAHALAAHLRALV